MVSIAAGGATLSVPLVVGAAIVDSINPCAFGVLIFISGYLLKISHDRRRVLVSGLGYVIGVYLTYLLLGMLIYIGIGQLTSYLRGNVLAVYFYQAIGLVIIIFGLLEWKEYLAARRGGFLARLPSPAIPAGFVDDIKRWTERLGSTMGESTAKSLTVSIAMGFLVALVELPCTGAPYLAVITFMNQAGLSLAEATPMLLAYNVIFVLPLLVIVGIVYRGTQIERLKAWKEENKGYMRLAAGALLIALGLFIFFFNFFFAG